MGADNFIFRLEAVGSHSVFFVVRGTRWCSTHTLPPAVARTSAHSGALLAANNFNIAILPISECDAKETMAAGPYTVFIWRTEYIAAIEGEKQNGKRGGGRLLEVFEIFDNTEKRPFLWAIFDSKNGG